VGALCDKKTSVKTGVFLYVYRIIKSMTQRHEELLDFGKSLAQDAGAIILRYFNGLDLDIQIKQDESPVTAADKEINQLVIDRVSEAFPTHGILAEEGSSHEDRRELWVCDPIDGTKSFIQRIPTALFSLAFVVDGVPEVAVMGDPFQRRILTAVRGEGAQMNHSPIKVSARSDLKGATIALTGTYSELRDRRQLLDDMQDAGAKIVLVPGNVFRSSLVASGNVDVHIFPGRSAHDVAAAKLIVEEAGGKVTDLYGKEQRYDGRICGAVITNGLLHNVIIERIAAFGPENYVGY
jgi:fructose-1,6-bisphosphatase/inositol monophosphatase family enzyme